MSDKPASKPATIKAIRGLEDLLPAKAQRFQFMEIRGRARLSPRIKGPEKFRRVGSAMSKCVD